MAISLQPKSASLTHRFGLNCFLPPKPVITTQFPARGFAWRSKRSYILTVCFAMEKKTEEPLETHDCVKKVYVKVSSSLEEKLAKKRLERYSYLVAAVMSSVGVTSMAVLSVYYRFSRQLQGSGEFPVLEMFGTFALSVAAAMGMEFWARWAHKALWHASLWHMHESHHRPRDGPFELNDVFAIVNAFPAISLIFYGFSNQGLVPGLCYGAGLGITVFGIAYMFVHDGLVHRRFPVGSIANVPYLRKVAAAHQIHHSEKFNGVPYGLFLGPQEVIKIEVYKDPQSLRNLSFEVSFGNN